MNYSQQLKHPNWQKKRLKIMELADFKCQKCGDKQTTLHIHHKVYEKGKLAWEYPDTNFTCLCENCHNDQHENCCDIKLYTLAYDKEIKSNILSPFIPLYCATCGNPIPQHF